MTSHADDKRAFMQTDGGAIPLAKWLTLSAAQYSGEDHGQDRQDRYQTATTVKYRKWPVTACQLS